MYLCLSFATADSVALFARTGPLNAIAKIYGGNKMRVYAQVWEGKSPTQFGEDYPERLKLREELRNRFMSR